jgi:hypothetical protein
MPELMALWLNSTYSQPSVCIVLMYLSTSSSECPWLLALTKNDAVLYSYMTVLILQAQFFKQVTNSFRVHASAHRLNVRNKFRDTYAD